MDVTTFIQKNIRDCMSLAPRPRVELNLKESKFMSVTDLEDFEIIQGREDEYTEPQVIRGLRRPSL